MSTCIMKLQSLSHCGAGRSQIREIKRPGGKQGFIHDKAVLPISVERLAWSVNNNERFFGSIPYMPIRVPGLYMGLLSSVQPCKVLLSIIFLPH